MGCFAVTSMALRPWIGWGTDRWGRRPFMMAGAVVFGLAPFHDFDSKVAQAIKDKLAEINKGLQDGSIQTGYKPSS